MMNKTVKKLLLSAEATFHNDWVSQTSTVKAVRAMNDDSSDKTRHSAREAQRKIAQPAIGQTNENGHVCGKNDQECCCCFFQDSQ